MLKRVVLNVCPVLLDTAMNASYFLAVFPFSSSNHVRYTLFPDTTGCMPRFPIFSIPVGPFGLGILKFIILNVCPVSLDTAIKRSSELVFVFSSSCHVTYTLSPDTTGSMIDETRVGPFGSSMLKRVVLNDVPLSFETAIKTSYILVFVFSSSCHVTYTLLPDTTGKLTRFALVRPFGSSMLKRVVLNDLPLSFETAIKASCTKEVELFSSSCHVTYTLSPDTIGSLILEA